MYYLMVALYALAILVIVYKVTQIIMLLFKLGVHWDVIKYLIIIFACVGFSIAIVYGNDYNTAGFVVGGILLWLFVPSLFETTRQKPKSGYGRKRPKYVTDTQYNWSYYGGSSSSDCGDAGGDGGYGGDGGSCD